MVGAGVRVEAEGFDEIIQALGRLSYPDLLRIAEYLGEELVVITEKAFETETDPSTGRQWERSLRAELTGGLTLTDTAGLRRSITHEAFSDGSVIIGSNKAYARIHQEGGKTGRGGKVTIPARPYLGVPSGLGRSLIHDRSFRELVGL